VNINLHGWLANPKWKMEIATSQIPREQGICCWDMEIQTTRLTQKRYPNPLINYHVPYFLMKKYHKLGEEPIFRHTH
jgi:hypothetical protein